MYIYIYIYIYKYIYIYIYVYIYIYIYIYIALNLKPGNFEMCKCERKFKTQFSSTNTLLLIRSRLQCIYRDILEIRYIQNNN